MNAPADGRCKTFDKTVLLFFLLLGGLMALQVFFLKQQAECQKQLVRTATTAARLDDLKGLISIQIDQVKGNIFALDRSIPDSIDIERVDELLNEMPGRQAEREREIGKRFSPEAVAEVATDANDFITRLKALRESLVEQAQLRDSLKAQR